jgi:hypothetical protein
MIAHDASPRFGRFTLRTECPRCGAHLPVNGPAPEVDCAECGQRTPVPDQVLVGVFEAFEERFPHPEKETLTAGDLTWRWTFEAVEGPTCPRCEAALTSDPVDGFVACGQCAAAVPSPPPPERLRTGPRISRVIVGELELTRDDQQPKPVVLACPACGAGLTVTSRHDRLTPCEYCGSQVHLPDAVWRALHPPKTVEPWFVRFEGPSRPAIRAERERAERERREEKERRDAEKRAERMRREEEESEARSRREAEEADRAWAAKVAREEAEARRLRWTLAPTLVCLALSLGVVAILGVAVAAWGVGHVPGLRIVGMTYARTRMLTDWGMVLALAPVLPVWLISVGVAALRGGKPLVGVTLWSAFMTGLTLIPFVGLFFALAFASQHFRGKEPTPDDSTLPFLTGWPLGVLYLAVPPYLHLAWLAAGDLGLVSL